MRRLTTRTFALAGLLLVASCNDDAASAPSEPSTPAHILGRITSSTPYGAYRGVILVEFSPEKPNEGPKALVNVTNATNIFTVTREEGEFRNLSTGVWVRVWFDGAVMESYPVQGTAGTIVVDSTGSSVQTGPP